ncbi:hypothetical protein QBC40DRAFT_261809 [Triangularia verruculosa]|uniref:Spo12-like protein n=1 Tax=Triangularia verruculosa TaxID=2587418 RepID=A0AAN6XRE5_9PEZI|nr:hypothetical protein QBC40DRAFT_261809 [Triangularia verruculosa]
MSANVLAAKDVNMSLPTQDNNNNSSSSTETCVKPDTMSMEYHRQVFQSKMQEEKTYISPSDNLMSPCTAKLSAFRNKQVGKNVKPKSLFAQASSKKLDGQGGLLFGSKPKPAAPPAAGN